MAYRSDRWWRWRVGAGALVWPVSVALLRPGWIEALHLLAPLVVVPLALRMAATGDRDGGQALPWRLATQAQLPAAALLVGAFALPPGPAAAALTAPWLSVTVAIAAFGLWRLARCGLRPVGELAIDAALVFLAVGGGWTLLSRLGARPLGFPAVIVLLTGVHFHYAGLALPLLTGLAARVEPGRVARIGAVGVTLGVPLVAAGIVVGGTLELVASVFLAAAGLLVAGLHLRLAVSGGRPGGVGSSWSVGAPARAAWAAAGLSLTFGMLLATAYAVGVRFGLGWLSIPMMARVHGSANAIGFALVGLLGWSLAPFTGSATSIPRSHHRRRTSAPRPGAVWSPARTRRTSTPRSEARHVKEDSAMAANPEALVSTEWVAEHLDDPNVVIAEVDEDATAYSASHIPGAVGFDWKVDFQDPLRRTFLGREGFAQLVASRGISNDSHVVLYGGNSNWFAAYAYWYFKIYGHNDVSLVDGGRKKWELEGRPLTGEPTKIEQAGSYTASQPNLEIRARRDEVLQRYVGAPDGTALVDVRSPAEFSGEVLAPPAFPQESAQVPGHIPGAKNISWGKAVNADTGEFLPVDTLRELYSSQGITADKDIVAYCRIGERSAHSWFVLHEILGYDSVRNYDGSWTEYGSLVDVPVERGA